MNLNYNQSPPFNVVQGPTAVEHAQHLRKTWYVAQVRCCATLVQILYCCITVAQLLHSCRTAATSIALTYTACYHHRPNGSTYNLRFVYWC